MNITKEEIEQLIDTKLEFAEKQYGTQFKTALIEILSLEKMLTPTEVNTQKSRLIPLSEWGKYHPYPTKGTLYQFNYNRETNGFSYCVQRGGENGGRILIDEDKFWEWFNNREQFRNNNF